jgi:hypothetical protein
LRAALRTVVEKNQEVGDAEVIIKAGKGTDLSSFSGAKVWKVL